MAKMKKTCKKCGIEKDIDDFWNMSGNTDGKKGSCKTCINEYDKINGKSYSGFAHALYQSMKGRVTGTRTGSERYIGKGLLSKSDFEVWIFNNPDYPILYESYKNSGFNRELAPSVDRKESSGGYTIDNIRLMTTIENISLGLAVAHKKRRSGIKYKVGNSGSKAGNVKLNEETVLVIRQRLESGDGVCKIARDYNLRSPTITAIKYGRTWKHILPKQSA